MIVPYRVNPTPPRMAILYNERIAYDEDGGTWPVDRMPSGMKIWTSQEHASELLAAGKGEALTWAGARIRWRPIPWNGKEDDWPVTIVQLPFPDGIEEQLEGMGSWRDWLARYGASPLGSVGSSSWSLLRASLEVPLWTSLGEVPPIKFCVGGRMELGSDGQGEFQNAFHLDFRAAYAQELGELEYGGRWHRLRPNNAGREAALAFLQRGGIGFVRCFVRIPYQQFGPLVERPTMRPVLPGLPPLNFPYGVTLQGIWTWQEIEAALNHGARLLRVTDIWIHLPGEPEKPFAVWWERIQRGREMKGFAGLLAKATGNALWGQFSISSDRTRTIVSYGRRNGKPYKVVRRTIRRGSRPTSTDLAETITGRIRAKAYDFMATAGEQLLSVHTDGGWVQGTIFRIHGMRRKGEADRIQLLTPQTLRYWPRGEIEPVAVVSGWPTQMANEVFERFWKEHNDSCTS